MCSVFQRVAVCCSVLHYVAVYCSVRHCAAVCGSVRQCVAVCGSSNTIRLQKCPRHVNMNSHKWIWLQGALATLETKSDQLLRYVIDCSTFNLPGTCQCSSSSSTGSCGCSSSSCPSTCKCASSSFSGTCKCSSSSWIAAELQRRQFASHVTSTFHFNEGNPIVMTARRWSAGHECRQSASHASTVTFPHRQRRQSTSHDSIR